MILLLTRKALLLGSHKNHPVSCSDFGWPLLQSLPLPLEPRVERVGSAQEPLWPWLRLLPD